MPLSAAGRSLRAQIAVHTLHSRRDGVELTSAAREAFLRSFERLVDADGVLAPEVRQRRAEHALRAHMARLSLTASRAREGRRAQPAPDATEGLRDVQALVDKRTHPIPGRSFNDQSKRC